MTGATLAQEKITWPPEQISGPPKSFKKFKKQQVGGTSTTKLGKLSPLNNNKLDIGKSLEASNNSNRRDRANLPPSPLLLLPCSHTIVP